MSLYRIGVDVGGTNTDAAILDIRAADTPGRGVLASYKASTTPEITGGIEEAIRAVLAASGIDQARVLSVAIGTTHFINALIEADARRLDRVAVVRLCGRFTRQIPPFSGFPVGLHHILDGGSYFLDGGLEMDGREIAPLDVEQIRQAVADIEAAGVRAVAIVGVYSPLDHDGIHEERCRKIILEAAPNLHVVCSHDIGPTGFLERENATILNAAILRTGHRVKRGFRQAMARLGLSCPLYLSQNDGTLIDAETAADFPIKAFASGPANSMAGAAFLAGITQRRPAGSPMSMDGDASEEAQILVVDIGGTTTDVCALLPSGFPRQAPGFVEFGGVRTAFSMPEVESIGLGGGSRVLVDETCPGAVSVGPGSVGHLIREQARVFGGPTLTATDVAVAAGQTHLGDGSLLSDTPRCVIDLARKEIKKKLEIVIDKMRVSAAPVTVLLVGGGALLVTDDLEGVESCIRPPHQGAANAIGAAIGKVSGEVDTVEILEGRHEREVIDAACKRAIDLAIEKGASRDHVEVVEVNRMPLQYMSRVTVRIQIKAAGPLAIPDDVAPPPLLGCAAADDEMEEEAQKVDVPEALCATTKPWLGIEIESYQPTVKNGVWYVSEMDLELMSTGCGVLGTGGGGPTYHEYLKSLNALRSGGQGKMRIISPKKLQDDDIVCMGMWYGSPSVINERLPGGNEIIDAIDEVNKIKGIKQFHALMVAEIGGANGMSAFPLSAHFDVPVVDGDGMGRAYPTLNHIMLAIHGHQMTPCIITDAVGNACVVMKVDKPARLEKLMRTKAIELGLSCGAATNPHPGSVIKSSTLQNTLSQAWYLGRAVHMARRRKANYIDAILDACAGKLLYSGKIVDVHRYIGGGYTMGAVVLAPLGEGEREALYNNSRQQAETDRHMVIPFQNEYLYAAYSDAAGSEASREVVCTVPDLVSILGQDGEAIGSQDLRYGLRVNVIALPAHPLWRGGKAMAVGGPEGFGLGMAGVGVDGAFTEARSVIDEFDS